jgi:type I restriction enzyme, S subunit
LREANGLPEGWEWAHLQDVASSGRTRNPKTNGEGYFLYVDIEAVDNRVQSITTPKRIRNSEAPSRARVEIKRGDVLFSLVRPYLKNIAKVPEKLDGQVASTAYCLVRPAPGISDSFLFHFLTQQSFINALPTYGNSPPAARDDEFYDMPIPVPPANEQRRIAAAIEEQLSRLDAGVSALERVRANLKRYRAAVLKAAVEGRLTEAWREENPGVEPASDLLDRILQERRQRWDKDQLAAYEKKGKKPPKNWRSKYKEPGSPDTSKLPARPDGWEWATLTMLCTSIGDVDYKMPKAQSEGVPYISTKDFLPNSGINFDTAKLIATEDYERLCRKIVPQRNDILMSRYGTVGEVRLVDTEQPFQASYSIAIIKPASHSISRYLALALQGEHVQYQIRRHTRATAQPDLGLGHIREFTVAVPPLEEQHFILEEVERRLSIVDEVETEVGANLKRAAILRQAILKRAFEGKLVPQDPSDEPASELLDRIRREREQASAKKPKKLARTRGAAKSNPAGHAGTLF